ncbi:MAG UNVERIFIED_CONTAM: ATP-binding protein [Anaerolineae bacterium]|jgi:DNA replication protein DnaC
MEAARTHLAAAIGNTRLDHGDVVLFLTAPDLLDHLRSTFGEQAGESYDALFERIRTTHLLILDDLGVENPSGMGIRKTLPVVKLSLCRKTSNGDYHQCGARNAQSALA